MVSMDSSIIVIPARGGSKGVKAKNRRLINGTPMFLRTLNHAEILASSSDLICLSSDDPEIWELFTKSIGWNPKNWNDIEVNQIIRSKNIIFHKRDFELSDDKSLVISLLQKLRELLSEEQLFFKTWCLLQPTSPFRSHFELEIVKRNLKESGTFHSLVSVTKIDDVHPARMYSAIGEKLVPLPVFEQYYYARRQDLPAVYIRDGGYYLIGDSLVKSGFQYSHSPRFIERKWPWSMNIDTVQDFNEATILSPTLFADDPNEKSAKHES